METGWGVISTLINIETGLQAIYSGDAKKERKKSPQLSVTLVVTRRVSNGRGVPLNTGALVSCAMPIAEVFAAPLDVVDVGARIRDDDEDSSTALAFSCCGGSLESRTRSRCMKPLSKFGVADTTPLKNRMVASSTNSIGSRDIADDVRGRR